MAMSVTKFFRKYNRHLLAIFMVGLMIAFLLPASLREIFRPDPSARELGEAYGKAIRGRDIMRIKTETAILESLNNAMMSADPQRRQRAFDWEFFVRGSHNPEIDYYLLILEAQKMGISVSEDQAERMLSESKIPAGLINAIIHEHGVPLRTVRQAVADYMSVMHATDNILSAVKVSNPELESMYKQISDRMTANIVPVGANSFVKQIPEPTEQKLAGYFATNQAKFQYPPRVQVEYLEADVDRIKDQIKVTTENARQYWQNHPQEFMTTKVPATQKGTTQPSATQPVQVPMTEKEAIPLAMEKVKTSKAIYLANSIVGDAFSASNAFWTKVMPDQSGVKKKPEKVSDYQQIATKISQSKHLPLIYHRTGLISMEDARALPGIGSAFAVEQNRPLFFWEYAFRVVAPKFFQPPATLTGDLKFLSPYQDSLIIRQIGDNGEPKGFYMFRVILADPSHLPQSLAEVKAKVVEDYKLAQAYEIAKKEAQALLRIAEREKLDQAGKIKNAELKKILATLKIKTVEPQTFSLATVSYNGQLVPPMIEGVRSNTAEFAKKCFENLWNQPTTRPNGSFPSVIIPDDANRFSYVVQLTGKKPATAEDFNSIKPMLVRFVLSNQQRKVLSNWFNPQNIHQRTGFRSIEGVPGEEY